MTFAQSSQSGIGFIVVAYFWKHFSQPGFSTRKKLRNHASSFIRLALWAFVLVASSAQGADVIPAERLSDWRVGATVGVIGGIPTRTEWTNFVQAGASTDPAANNTTLLNALIAACPSNKYINVSDAGRYRFGTAISFSRGGWSVVATVPGVEFFHATSFINHDGSAFAAPLHIYSHLAKGDTNLSLRSTLDSGYVGKLAQISAQNYGRTNAQVMSSGYHDRRLNHYVRIDSITDGTNVTFWPPILMTTATNLNPWFHPNSGAPSEYWGFENMTITGTNTATGDVYDNSNINIIIASRNWWFRNCTFINPRSGFQFNLVYNQFAEIRDCRFFSSGSGANTSVIIASADAGILVENNYSHGGNPFVQANNSSGWVISYNYITNAVADDIHVGNPLDIHQPHSHNNLWEGNNAAMFQNDAYHGSSSDQILYRNKLTGYDPIKPSLRRCVDIGRWGTNYTVVANDLGDTNATYWYTTTNQFYDSGAFGNITGLTFRFGFPRSGDSSYGENKSGGPYNAIKTPERSFNYPGTNFFLTTVTQATSLTNIVWGAFTTIPSGDNGPRVVGQAAADTNYYYYYNTNFNLNLQVSEATSSNITLTHTVWVTNGDSLYIVGPNAWPHLDLQGTNGHFIEANYVISNSANQSVRWTGATNEAGLPDSLYLSARPAWFTNSLGSVMNWPPFGYATEGQPVLTNRLPAQSLAYDAGSPAAPTGTSAKTGQGRTKNKGPRGRFFQP